MAISTQLQAADSKVATSPGGRKLLQRLVRKIQHVLIIRHCIDDLRESGGLERGRKHDIGRKHQTTLPSEYGFLGAAATLPHLSSLYDSKDSCSAASKWIALFATLALALEAPSPQQSLKQSLEAFSSRKGLLGLERLLDQYVADCSGVLQKAKNGVFKDSSEVWISWAKKRGGSCRDQRCQAVLLKLFDNGSKLQVLKRYLDAYYAYNQARESLVDVVCRLRAVFNVGWFFEWPRGRHPLNSTWPWADVKPSLVVLWGVCWMFYPALNSTSQHLQRPGLFSHHQTSYMPWNDDAPNRLTPMRSSNQQAAMPRTPDTRVQQQNQYLQPMAYDHFQLQYMEDMLAAADDQMDLDLQIHVDPDLHIPRYGVPVRPESSSSRQYPYGLASFPRNSNFQPEEPTQAINYQPSQPRQPQFYSNLAHMPSSPVPFSYPPLDNMSGLQDSKPYMAHERDYPQIPDHDYDPQHDQQDGLHRYPSPSAHGLSENPYNAQQLVDATSDGRVDMAVGRMDSSPPASPGRSKPVPKPQREVTKLDNGRFYCDWPNCTEEVKDFGRKCEWSKHMDKHDRPYKCPAEGCEKLPGFTYSGGLLRHEREVHNKHGGPRKQLNCPHENCKRHTGKGFSRQENLNEHLRRVHTGGTPPAQNGEDTEEDGGEARAGMKRKRTSRANDEERDQEVAQLRQENQELRHQIEALTHQTTETMRQIMQLQQNQLNAGLQRLNPPTQMA